METEFPFRAGALFKWVKQDKLTDVQGRVIIYMECGNEDDALEMRKQMFTDPRLVHELLATIRPWPDNIVKIDTEELNKHTSVKSIMSYGSEE